MGSGYSASDSGFSSSTGSATGASSAREAAEAKGEGFKYDKHCLRLSKEEVQAKLDAGEPWVIRQNIPTTGKAGFDDVIYGHVEVDCDTLDDNVLIKADGLPTYSSN